MVEDGEPLGAREKGFDAEENSDGSDENHDECFEIAEAAMLEQKDDQHVEAGDDDADDERDVEEQLQRDG